MPIIPTASVDAVKAFYEEKLGFGHEMGMLGEDGSLDFCVMTKDGAMLMFRRAPEPPAKPEVDFYLGVADVDAFHRELCAKGLDADPPENMWWGDRVFAITDPTGRRLTFFQNVSEPRPPAGSKIV